MTEPITAVAMDAGRAKRAHYVALDADGRPKHTKHEVVAWAAVGANLLPVRLDAATGRGVLVGTEADPDLEFFFGVLGVGEDLNDLPYDADERIRLMLQADRERRDLDSSEEADDVEG